MILKFCVLTLLLATTNIGAQRIKGGPRIVSEPHIHVGKGGGIGAKLHHTAVVTDPVSLNPVVVDKVTDLGPSSAQFSIADAQIPSFGSRNLYRLGASQIPYGLSGLDYYSYPASLLTARRGLSRKTIVTDGSGSGLSPIGFGGRKSAIIADPTTAQFSVGDSQIRSFGGSRLYRSGVSSVPFGLSGLDYYSYPNSLSSILGGGSLGQTQILSGGGFTSGDAQVSSLVAEPIGQEKVIVESSPVVQATQEIVPEPVTTIVEDGGFGQRRLTTIGNAGGLRGGQIILRGGPALGLRRVKSRPAAIVQAPAVQEVLVDPTSGLGAPFGGFGQRQVVAKTVAAPAPAQVVVAQAPVARVVTSPIGRRLGESFLTHAARPLVAARRVASFARPVAIQQAPAFPGNIQFTLGNTQIIGGGGHSIAPAPVVVQRPAPVVVQRPAPVVVQRPAAFAIQRPVAIQRPAAVVLQSPVAVQRPVVSVQQPVISQVKTAGFGARRLLRQFPQMYYSDGGSHVPGIDIIGGYRIGDPRFNYGRLNYGLRRFANLGLNQASIEAGPVLLSPPAPFATKGGISSPSKIVTQEEVIGPAGDSQIVTTVTDAGPSKIGGPVIGGGLAGIGGTGGTKTITQEEVIGPAGDSQIVTTVTQSGPSKIGGAAIGGPLGLTAVGQSGPAQVVTQEEVIGPAGDSQIVTTVTNAGPSKIGGPVVSSPLGLSGIGKTSPAKVVTQEEVIGPAGDRQVVTTVSDAGPSKIGGAAIGGPLGLTAVGHSPVTKTVTQEEVIGPAGDSQVVTTVTSSQPSKIGGAVLGGGLAGIGQTPTKVITQEEVVGPAGDSQIITTVSESSNPIVQQEDIGISSLTSSPFSQEIAQGPIETALSQETLGDSAIISSGSSLLSPLSQSSIDPIGSGQTQLAIDDVIGPSIGASGGGYVPRVSFLSSFPYDVPSRSLLRQALTRPIVQEQQQLEQILV